VSNDIEAIDVLRKNSYSVACPTLRAFDVITFGYQIGCLREQDCDGFRYQMQFRERNEYVPKDFRSCSFKDGLVTFCPRLLDANLPPIGALDCSGLPFKSRLLLRRVTTPGAAPVANQKSLFPDS
jgi:hypothetical protein